MKTFLLSLWNWIKHLFQRSWHTRKSNSMIVKDYIEPEQTGTHTVMQIYIGGISHVDGHDEEMKDE